MTARHGRALEIARRLGADGVLAAEPSTVAWLTGFAADIESGPSAFALPPLPVVTSDGPPILVVSEDDALAAPQECEVFAYTGFTIGELDLVGGASRALQAAVDGRTLATEPAALSSALASELRLVDASAELRSARAVKDPDEIELVRAAVELCDIGQAHARGRHLEDRAVGTGKRRHVERRRGPGSAARRSGEWASHGRDGRPAGPARPGRR